ncbi:type II restriction endonuclease [Calycomorphotria hydatis]|uniref:Type-2 restriction enzyme EcoRII n=1 Tax=Calycomorphotria hydatis TaxID=2528027 RepID=A0A517T600_9PLAN|nr:type II restriction endonuclease [Calycomorphotria hydatis]QDT63799.1 Type-2 restriction enzyme EcoRII [Calycomorphotria hydatis]
MANPIVDLADADLLERLKEVKKQKLLSGFEVVKRATSEELGDRKNDSEWLKANFSILVEHIQERAYRLYLESEKPACVEAFREVLGPDSEKPFSTEFEKHFFTLDRFFLALTQGRRPRAGKAFEHVITVLFSKLQYPYASQPIINGQPDFLLPSVAHYEANAVDCIIFTVKRTLRERWRQIVTEGTRGFQFFLATIDESIAARDLDAIRDHRIHLVLPERIRAERYSDRPNAISFETFFRDHLDPAMARWKNNDVI